MNNHSDSHAHQDHDIDLVALWLKKDPKRLTAGVMGGLFAAIAMMLVAMIFAVSGGYEFLFPIKVAAIPILGASATEVGFHMVPLLTGLLVHAALCSFLGAVYAHFTHTNRKDALLAAGFVWGFFSWVFISNLFTQSFGEISALQLPRGPALFIHLAFGFSLATTGFFDRMLRKKA